MLNGGDCGTPAFHVHVTLFHSCKRSVFSSQQLEGGKRFSSGAECPSKVKKQLLPYLYWYLCEQITLALSAKTAAGKEAESSESGQKQV